MPRQGGSKLLAAKRSFDIGEGTYETPMVVPSFSSRGFPDVKKIIAGAQEYVTEQTLISAYDLYYGLINKTGWTFPNLIFVDSGGYEKGEDTDLSDHRRATNKSTEDWNLKLHLQALKKWNFPRPTALVSYDNPIQRVDFLTQIERAKQLFSNYPHAASELLLKAPKKVSADNPEDGYVNVAMFKEVVGELTGFSIIGVTEKELGNSLMIRLKTIYGIRKIMHENHMDQPLHIFGSLDPISMPLYFLAGADIFDGLTWLRFGYHSDLAIYRHNFSALRFSHEMNERTVNMTIHQQNHNELMELRLRMRRFINNQDYNVFGLHSALFEKCMDELSAYVGDS